MYYGYARVSTRKQRDTSIEVQLEFLRLCANNLAMEFVPLYEKKSGKSIEGRYVFKDLLSRVERGDIVGVYDNSRLGRNTEENLAIVKDLSSRGVRVQINGRIYDFNNPQDELSFSIESSVSTYQRKSQILKSVASLNLKRSSGNMTMRGDCFGYRIIKKGKNTIAEIEPFSAAIIKNIFNYYVHGLSSCEIAKKMIKEVDKVEFLKIKGKTVETYFRDDTIRRILMRPIYMGYYIDHPGKHYNYKLYTKQELKNKLIKSNIYPPIISEDLWWKTFDSWRTLKRTRSVQFEMRWSKYELSSIFSCGDCGKKIVHCYSKSPHSNTVTEVYTCHSHTPECEIRNARGYRKDLLEMMMRGTFFLTLSMDRDLGAFFEKDKRELEISKHDLENKINLIEEDIKEVDRKIMNLISTLEITGEVKVISERIKDLKTEKELYIEKRNQMEYSLSINTMDLDGLLENMSEDIIEKFINGSSQVRRDFYLKFLNKSLVMKDYFLVEYKNGKRYELDYYKKGSSNPKNTTFRIYDKNDFLVDGVIDFENYKFEFNKIDSKDIFINYSNTYFNKIFKKVNKLLQECKVTGGELTPLKLH